ncbi:hypothetical protein C5Y97_08810 [Blastopirellula marina]|uniref:Uncharacterized protein n=2 Tax=Blastopirellula marina TaxID=124 RepID=A0A2S8G204_9BACT|nr:hypothetical protein C5Y98_08805 [Blastopirellula marina]PTL44820.1 hypothetical protein C5Y97_08810 [Blastopirellula marina]
MTIVELLVVMGILVALLGIAATAVKTGTRGKKQREAARQVNAYIASAQARAVQLGRPVGVEIVRNVSDSNGDGTILFADDTGVSNSSLLMYTLETPPPYAGDAYDSQIDVNSTGGNVTLTDTTGQFVGASPLLSTGTAVKVRLGYRGPKYNATVTQASPLILTFSLPVTDHRVLPMKSTCQIFLPPQRSSATPLQLPTDMCIDLTCSGWGNSTGNQFANWNSGVHDSVRFTFSPKGNVDQVSTVDGTWARPGGNIHILVGKYDHAIDAIAVMQNENVDERYYTGLNYLEYITPTVDPDLETNLADGSSMWVSINNLTGQITTTRNKLITSDFLNSPAYTSASNKNAALLAETRDFARSGLIIKGQGDE